MSWRSIVLILFFPILTGCMTDQLVQRQEFEIFQSAVSRRLERIGHDHAISQGATRENRQAIEVLSSQLEEVHRRLGMINQSMKKVGDLENKFNNKLGQVMEEVVKENERIIDEINRTRQSVKTSSTSSTSSSSKDVNIYSKQQGGRDLNTGYYHVVEPGESISKIAHRYQVPIQDIVEANDLENPDALYVGQELFIPDPGK